MLAQPTTVAVIAPDSGLRQAIAFSLEVEGFSVSACEAWRKDCDTDPGFLCLIIDDRALRHSTDARTYLAQPGKPVIMLADGLSPPPVAGLSRILTKPFDGAELLRMVRDLVVPASASRRQDT